MSEATTAIPELASSRDEEPSQPIQSTQQFNIVRVREPADIEAVRVLFEQYAAELNIDLSHQSFAEELASLPGKYSPEMGGEILLARRSRSLTAGDHHVTSDSNSDANRQGRSQDQEQGEPLGCVALRSLSLSTYLVDTPPPVGVRIAEVKRLFALPSTRGMGVGHALTRMLIEVAKELEYDELRLDTLPHMKAGINIYEKFGFVDVKPYCFNPIPGARFMGYKLK